MKAVILAGGLGTRLAEETHLRPKPMVEVSGKPMLWHILKTYSHHGINEFIICCGYRGYMIKEYFANYFLHSSDVTFHMESNHMEIHKQNAEPWKVTLVDTGEATLTGGRLARVSDYLNDTFCFTYGDGVADVDIQALVQPPGRYGAIGLDGYQVQQCQEKPDGDGGWINGGYFVLEPLYQALLEQGVLEHVPTTPATPKHLGFEAQRALAERLGDGYDLYGYLEDDLLIQDPLFFHKIFWFQQHMGSDAVLLPHRMELFWQPDRLLEKLYIDGPVPEADLQALLRHPAEPMAAPLPGGNIVFAPPANPHSGCFFLTHSQLQHWSEQPWFLDGDSSYVSPLESAATLGICKTFRIYKPHLAYAAFLELQHWGTSFRNLIGNGVTPPDPAATSG